jgi:hypothetical protein
VELVRLHGADPVPADEQSLRVPVASADERVRTLAPSSSSAAAAPPVPLQPCPEENASCLSYTYLLWLNPMFKRGTTKTLEDADVPAVRKDNAAAFVSALFRKSWAEQLPIYTESEKQREAKEAAQEQAKATKESAKKSKAFAADGVPAPLAAVASSATLNRTASTASLAFNPKEKVHFHSYSLLYNTLYRMYGRRYYLCGFLKASYDASNFAQPVLLAALVTHIKDSQNADYSLRPPTWHGYALAAGMIGLSFFGITMLNLFQRITYGIGQKCRTALITALYRKAFRLSPRARAQMSTGQIVNMMATDATMVDQCAAWMVSRARLISRLECSALHLLIT